MSGITLKHILFSTNWYVPVAIHNEFGDILVDTKLTEEMLQELTQEQLEVTFDFITIKDDTMILGISKLKENYFK